MLTIVAITVSTTGAFADTKTDEKAIAILKSQCYQCHGPDTQHENFRLDSLSGLTSGGDSGKPAIAPGNSAASHLIERITSPDPKIRMPFNRPKLSPDKIQTLTEWINSGANWPEPRPDEHWSFIVPNHANPPETPEQFPIRNAIDNFVIDAALKNNLTPNPLADRYTLLRRASLELTGLPPTEDEIETFIRDTKPGAYDRLLDRLFASPHYGERQALPWLDIARYADTNGYEKDRPRSIWMYRDWVINAYNDNLPFDQFVRDQLAGDLLPNPNREQLIATGFHRNTMLNEEGGIDADEDRYKRTVDRTNTTSTAFLGLTMSCAQCHTHKSDPISRNEYYEFFAFFNDTEETILPLFPEQDQQKVDRADRISEGLQDWITWLGTRDEETTSELEAWIVENAPASRNWITPTPTTIHSEKGATLELQNDNAILATGDIPNDDTYTIDLPVTQQSITAIRLEVLPHDSLPGNGPGRGTILAEGDFLLSEFDAQIVNGDEVVDIPISETSESFAMKDKTAEFTLDGKADTGWSIKHQIGMANRAVFVFDESVQVSENSLLRIVLSQDYIHQHTIGFFRLSYTTDSGEIVASPFPAHVEAALATSDANKHDNLARYYFTYQSKPLKKWRDKRDSFLGDKPQPRTTLVMAPRMPKRDTRVHNRGEFDQPRRKVKAGTPKILPPLSAETEPNRLDLANWITSPENPLTARVVMNRLWQQVFGRGIVSTPEDFGIEGEPPTHPELLDFLALEFINSGWDMKHMHRLMVSSATFRQTSNDTPEEWTSDPDNTWLARGPRFRLDAEHIRDLALTASGLLTETIGGESVYPPQPEGVTSLAYGSTAWPTDEGENRYRRGIYTYLKRTAPYAAFTTFDAPMKEEACARRDRSNTPLQALTLLNDQVFLEVTHALAKNVITQKGSVKKKIDALYLACLTRHASDHEKQQLATAYEDLLTDFEANPIDTKKFVDDDTIEENVRAEFATWKALARVVLNLDETITRG